MWEEDDTVRAPEHAQLGAQRRREISSQGNVGCPFSKPHAAVPDALAGTRRKGCAEASPGRSRGRELADRQQGGILGD